MIAKVDIPHQRILIYLLILGILPMVWAFTHVSGKLRRVGSIITQVDTIHSFASLQDKRQERNRAVIEVHRDADHFYIDKHLETMRFLETEVAALQKLTNQEATAGNEAVSRRFEHLVKNNKMQFVEGVVQTTTSYQETTETLATPVEIDASDLREILAKIDGITIGPYGPASKSPQLLVLSFKITKQTSPQKNEVFLLNLKLLKREFL